MKSLNILFPITLICLIISCSDNNVILSHEDILGVWVEKTDNSFKQKLEIFNDSLLFQREDTTYLYFYNSSNPNENSTLELQLSPYENFTTSSKITIQCCENDVLTTIGLGLSYGNNPRIIEFKLE